MIHEQKIKYMEMAASICHFHLNESQMDLLVSIYEVILQKEGEFALSDAAEIQVDVTARERQRNVRNALDKISEKV